MIYIIVALKAEAQAFVDKYKLQNYKNDLLHVVISGVGCKNMQKTTQEIIKHINSNDKIANVGVCGADERYPIGTIIDGLKQDITLVEREINTKEFEIVDMESECFLQATSDFKNRYVFRVVSDNFQPHILTKDGVKKLIFDNLDEIMRRIKDEKSSS